MKIRPYIFYAQYFLIFAMWTIEPIFDRTSIVFFSCTIAYASFLFHKIGWSLTLGHKKIIASSFFYLDKFEIESKDVIDFYDYLTIAWVPVLSVMRYWKGNKQKRIFFNRLLPYVSLKAMNEKLNP